jgi:LPXTG-motif cell wall-anchored protein
MKKVTVLVLTAVVLAIICTVPALAATPQSIYDDFVASGSAETLTGGPYTVGDLQAYLNDATVHQYGDAAVLTVLDDLVNKVVKYMQQGKPFDEALKLAKQGDRPFPFTGAQIALIAAAGVLLVGLGILLRRKRT